MFFDSSKYKSYEKFEDPITGFVLIVGCGYAQESDKSRSFGNKKMDKVVEVTDTYLQIPPEERLEYLTKAQHEKYNRPENYEGYSKKASDAYNYGKTEPEKVGPPIIPGDGIIFIGSDRQGDNHQILKRMAKNLQEIGYHMAPYTVERAVKFAQDYQRAQSSFIR